MSIAPIVCRKRSMHATGPHIWSRPRPSASTVWCAPPSTPMKTRYNGRYSIYSVLVCTALETGPTAADTRETHAAVPCALGMQSDNR